MAVTNRRSRGLSFFAYHLIVILLIVLIPLTMRPWGLLLIVFGQIPVMVLAHRRFPMSGDDPPRRFFGAEISPQ